MANVVTDYGQQYWSSVLFGLQPVPSDYWIALATAEPGKSVDGTQFRAQSEVSAVDYARVDVLTGPSFWELATSGFVVNVARIFIGSSSVDWGVVKYYVLLDDPMAGNLYCYGQVDNPQRVPAGSSVAIPPGAITIQTASVLPSIAP